MFQENYNEAENIGAKVNAAMRDEREPGLETLQRFSYLRLLHATIADAISWVANPCRSAASHSNPKLRSERNRSRGPSGCAIASRR